MRNTLICTVGTSLFGNLRNINVQSKDEPDIWDEIKNFYDNQNWTQLAKALLKLDPYERNCGAEINTIFEAEMKNWLDLQNIIFLVSDTSEGRNTGNVIKHYFENQKELDIRQVEVKSIENLQDKNPKQFKTIGLRNLVRALGDYINQFGYNQVAIDATGGYKAQIALAVLMGQAMNIPVYYKHEFFSEIIDFPPLPVALDFDLLGENAGLLTDFEKGKVFSQSEINELDEKLRVFLTEIQMEGEKLFELNAIGQLYLTAFRLRYPKAINLIPANEDERKAPTFGNDHHFPNYFKKFVNKVFRENNWIKTCYTISYEGQQQIKGIDFYVKQAGKRNSLLGDYKEKDFGARFKIRLTDESRPSLNWAAVQLNQKYKNKHN